MGCDFDYCIIFNTIIITTLTARGSSPRVREPRGRVRASFLTVVLNETKTPTCVLISKSCIRDNNNNNSNDRFGNYRFVVVVENTSPAPKSRSIQLKSGSLTRTVGIFRSCCLRFAPTHPTFHNSFTRYDLGTNNDSPRLGRR